MRRIAPIRLEYDPKTLWFDPGELEIVKDQAVVVNTARGNEFGVAASGIVEVEIARGVVIQVDKNYVFADVTALQEGGANKA